MPSASLTIAASKLYKKCIAMRRAIDLTLALGCVALLLASIREIEQDNNGRKAARAFFTRYELNIRRPQIASTIDYVPSPDWTAEVIADSALRDAFDPVNLTDVSPRVREAWITSAAHADEELAEARLALLGAMQSRPGWPYYQYMLGETTFAIESRAFSPSLVEKPERWARPMLYAARATATAPEVWRSIAAAYLRTWPALSDVHLGTAREVFGHAFSEPYFVNVGFPDAARLLGSDEAIRYLPEVPMSLRAAFDHFAAGDDTLHAWEIHQRWERAEWRNRTDDLAAIEEANKRNDFDNLALAIDRWIGAHPVWRFDSAAARVQAARVLELWPGRRRGSWTSDPLADVARYLLTRNVDRRHFMPIIARSVPLFSAVPVPVAAEIKLASGDVTGAERIALAAEDAGSTAWSHYILLLAKRHAEAGDTVAAAAALARLPAKMRDTHEAMIVRGMRADDDPIGQLCGSTLDVPLHGAPKQRGMSLRLTSQRPTLVDFGVDGARSETLLIAGTRDVPLTLVGWEDKMLYARSICGDRNACLSISSAP